MGKVFFTADWHLNHQNIIRFCNRPFSTVEEMNAEIIRRHNERVGPSDTTIFVGDFCFVNSPGGVDGGRERASYWISKMNGHPVFIRGNHDRNNSLKTKIEALVFKINKEERAFVIHNPRFYSDLYPINIVGHVHDRWRTQIRDDRLGPWPDDYITLVNVGVDVWNFYPVTWPEIQWAIKQDKAAALRDWERRKITGMPPLS